MKRREAELERLWAQQAEFADDESESQSVSRKMSKREREGVDSPKQVRLSGQQLVGNRATL